MKSVKIRKPQNVIDLEDTVYMLNMEVLLVLSHDIIIEVVEVLLGILITMQS